MAKKKMSPERLAKLKEALKNARAARMLRGKSKKVKPPKKEKKVKAIKPKKEKVAKPKKVKNVPKVVKVNEFMIKPDCRISAKVFDQTVLNVSKMFKGVDLVSTELTDSGKEYWLASMIVEAAHERISKEKVDTFVDDLDIKPEKRDLIIKYFLAEGK